MSDFPERLIALQPFWGSWVLDGFIGEGSYGRVYRIRREEMGKVTYSALKWITLPKNQADLKEFRTEGLLENEVRQLYRENINRFREEIDLMSQLKGNSHLVNYEDHLVLEREREIGWDILIRMELLTPLSDRFQAGMTVGDVVHLGLDLCDALSRCAKVRIIHRDIKADNIFISKFGDYKLGDFGVARSMEENATHMSKQGTPIYMAPEIYLGKRTYNSTVDIYSLGLVMHRLLNRQRLPFLPMDDIVPTHAQRDAALETRLRGTPIPQPVDGGIMLAKVICRACAFDPKDRFQTANDMRDALQKAAERTDLSKALTINPTGVGLRSGRSSLNPDIMENCESVNRNSKILGQNDLLHRRHVRWPWIIVAVIAFLATSILGTKLWMERTNQPETTSMPSAATAPMPTPTPTVVPTATPTPTAESTATPELLISSLSFPNTEVEEKVRKAAGIPDDMIITSDIAAYITELDLSDSSIDDINFLSDYISLEDLDLSGNQISNIGTLANLTNLIDLTLDENYISDLTPLNGLTSLLYLSINNNRIYSLEGIETLVKLHSINLKNNNISDISPLAEMKELSKMDIAGNQIIDISLIRSLNSLQMIRLDDNGVRDISPLEELNNLSVLSLNNNQITDVTPLVGLNNLTWLEITGNEIADFSPLEALSNLAYLKEYKSQTFYGVPNVWPD